MRVLTPSDYKQTFWKNGGGRTDELLVQPCAAGSFLWRISIATIAASGPFSLFPGIDRIIMTLSGPAVHLDFADGHSQELARLVPYAFPGENEVFGRLAPGEGSATDFNVMTRRSDCAAALSCEVLAKGARKQLISGGAWIFVYVISGSLRVSDGAAELTRAYSLCLNPGDRDVTLQATSDCQLVVTLIEKK